MKKPCVLLGLLFFTSSLFSQTGWMWQNPLPQGNELRSSTSDFVVGAGGTVIHKSFYGWDIINIGTKENLNDIWINNFRSGGITNGWIVGDKGTIFYTDDGGENWSQQNSGTTETLRAIVSSGYTTWACGDHATLLKTRDNGQNWEKISTFISDLDFYGMSLHNVKTSSYELWIAGEDGLIISTGDGGLTWTSHYGGTSWDFMDINMIDYSNSLICGKSGIIISKKWDEENWHKENESLEYKLNSIIGSGYAVGSNGTILRATDERWVKKETDILWELNDIRSHTRPDLTDSDRSVYGQYGIMLEDDGYDSEFRITNDLFWHWVQSIEFVNKDTGWAVGGDPGWGGTTDGVVLYTTDGGENWIVQKELQTPLNDMDFVNQDEGWAVGRDGLILHTSSGGAGWGTQPGPVSGTLTSVSFVDENNGWAVSMSNWGQIIHTTNGGVTWVKQTGSLGNVSGMPLYDVFFIDENKGWAVGLEAAVIKTTDGGTNWESIDVNPSQKQRFTSVFFVDELNGWIAGTGGILMRTTNGGNTWQEEESGTDQMINDIYFIDAEKGWAVGHPGTILHTTDGGINWYKQASGVATNTLACVFFIDANKGWAGGEGGTILHTIRGGSMLTNTFHVNDDNNSGIEDGSEEHPFTSVAEAIDVAAAGDSVIIHPGTYDESPLLHMDIKDGLIIVGEDSANTFIPLPFYMGELTMKYTTEITGLTCPGYSFANSEGKATVKIKGCHFEDMDISALNGYTFIVEDCTIEGSVNNTGGANMITIRNNHFKNGGINISGETREEMSAVVIEGNRIDRNELPPGHNTYQQFANLSSENADISFASAAIVANSTYTTITNNIISIMDEESGIIVPGGFIAEISENVINLPEVSTPDHQTVGIKTAADTGMVYKNTISGGFYGLYSNSPATVFNNNIISNAHTGFYGRSAGKVQYNEIKNGSGNGLIAEGISGPVEGNTISDNDSSGILILSPADFGGGRYNSEGLNVLRNNAYYDMWIKYQPAQPDTVFAMYNLWDHETSDEILANDVLNEGAPNLSLELSSFVKMPSVPLLISPSSNVSVNSQDTSLTWQQTAVYDRYHLQLALDGSFANPIVDTTPLKDTTFMITPHEGNTYFWRVRSENPAGESDWSEIWQFTTDVAGFPGIEKEPVPIEVFPNPANSTLTIRSEIFKRKPVNIFVIDLNGKKLLQKSIPSGSTDIVLDISEINNGIYFCYIQTQKYSLIRKIIIQK